MKKERLFWSVVVSGLILSFLLGGCATSRRAKFYNLSPMKSAGTEGKESMVSEPAVTVGVGPVEIPDYLNQPQIVTRTAQNELEVAEFDRWGGSFRDDIARVLLENLSVILFADRILVVPWNRGGPLQYRVALNVIRLDATRGGNVLLKANWTIFDQDGKKVLMTRNSSFDQPVSGRDYATLVSAMDSALGKLSQDMADGLKSVLSGKGASRPRKN